MIDLTKYFTLTDKMGIPIESKEMFGAEEGGLRATNFLLWLNSMNASAKCHWMIDMETLGLTDSCAIVQIGMAPFDPKGKGLYTHAYNGEYYSVTHNANLKVEGQLRYVDPETKEWWETKNTANLHLLTGGTVLIADELNALAKVFTNSSQVWANSPSFDIDVLRHACKQWRVPLNLNFRNEWDVRTVSKLAGFTYGKEKDVFKEADEFWNRGPNAHDALNDVFSQIYKVQRSIRILVEGE